MSYVDLDDVRDWLAIPDSVDDAELNAVLAAVDFAIDDVCGQRFAQSTLTARTFVADTAWAVRLGPSVIGDTTGLVVKTDEDGDGTFETTWTTSDYVTFPLGGVGADGSTGWPIRELRSDSLRAKCWPIHYNRRPGVQITALWGWAAVPASVTLAARMLAGAWYQRRTTVSGQGGFQGFFESAVRDDPTIGDLLAPYRRRTKGPVLA